MNFTKKVAIALTVSTFLSTGGVSLVQASTVNAEVNSMTKTSTKLQFSDSDIARMNKYVNIDTNSMKYILTQDAVKNLNKKNLLKLNEALKIANAELENLNNYNLNIDSAKQCFKITVNKPSNSDVQVRSISTSKYWDYELFWWGKRLYFHNNFISDLQAYVRTYTAAGAATSSAIALFMTGVIGTTGPVGALFGSVAALELMYFYDRLVNKNTGSGVYADAFWSPSLIGLAPTSFKYYSA